MHMSAKNRKPIMKTKKWEKPLTEEEQDFLIALWVRCERPKALRLGIFKDGDSEVVITVQKTVEHATRYDRIHKRFKAGPRKKGGQ